MCIAMTIDPEKLEEAGRILNVPLPVVPQELLALSMSPDTWRVHLSELDASLNLLLEAKPFSIRLQPPPPLWTKDGNEVVRQYYEANPDHPLADDDHARARRGAAYKLMFWASVAPDAFTPKRIDALCDCLFDCDAAVRHDVLRAIAFLRTPSVVAVLKELLEREPESDSIRAMATLIQNRLKA
jgi:HEAT repeat protein